MVDAGKISPTDMDLLHLTDDVDEVVQIMLDADQQRRGSERAAGRALATDIAAQTGELRVIRPDMRDV
jgi:hypothetical protein